MKAIASIRTRMQINQSNAMKNRSNVTKRQKNRRTTDIRPSSTKPATKSSEYKLIEADCENERAAFEQNKTNKKYNIISFDDWKINRLQLFSAIYSFHIEISRFLEKKKHEHKKTVG